MVESAHPPGPQRKKMALKKSFNAIFACLWTNALTYGQPNIALICPTSAISCSA